MFIGCDYPFIKTNDLTKLSFLRSQENLATAYFNEQSNFFEPLLAIYEPKSYPELLKQFAEGKYSLNKFLDKSNAVKIIPENPSLLNNINTLEEYNSYKSNSKKS